MTAHKTILPEREELERRYDDWAKYHITNVWKEEFKELFFQFIDKVRLQPSQPDSIEKKKP